MAILPLNRKREKALNDFAKEYKTRTLAFLNQYFHLCKEDCEDVFQEASITLYLKATEGELENLTSSLYTYFIGICRNKAFEQVRKNKKSFALSFDEVDENGKNNETLVAKADRILQITEENEQRQRDREQMVQSIVKHLPSPCNELLWAYYRDVLSMKAIASMFGYASESVAKVTKHRCMEKFQKTYQASTLLAE